MALLAALATVVYLGPPLPDGRREVTLQLDTPLAWLVDSDDDSPSPPSLYEDDEDDDFDAPAKEAPGPYLFNWRR